MSHTYLCLYGHLNFCSEHVLDIYIYIYTIPTTHIPVLMLKYMETISIRSARSAQGWTHHKCYAMSTFPTLLQVADRGKLL